MFEKRNTVSSELISVIVPVYNVEDYLKECVDSILQQTYKNIEVILVDDGSTDSSGEICDDFAKKDGRIQVFHKENGGAASAKNVGLDHMTGSYVMIVDSDDKIEAGLIETLYQLLKKHDAEIAIGDYYLYNQNDNMFYFYVAERDYRVDVIDCQVAIDRQLEHTLNTATYIVPWCKLYQSDLFQYVRFPEGRKFDDESTVHRLYLKAEKIAVVVENLYMYRVGQKSEMNSPFNLTWVKDVLNVFETKLSDVALAGMNIKTVRQRLINVLNEYKSLMESHGWTDKKEYEDIVYRLNLLKIGAEQRP